MIILLTVLLEREKDHIVFLDEPEISLHIDWQYRLIDMLTSLNPNAQFVLTTHSPAIFQMAGATISCIWMTLPA